MIRKWQDRESPVDGSHCPKTMYTTLTPDQELIAVELRRTLLLPADDLLAVTHVSSSIRPSLGLAWVVACAGMACQTCAT
jgi:hypothetical protein